MATKKDIAKKMTPPDQTNFYKKRMAIRKGKESLNMPKGEKNEGEHMYLGKNENNRP